MCVCVGGVFPRGHSCYIKKACVYGEEKLFSDKYSYAHKNT